MPYTIEEHNHRLAAWAASTSASASPICRFKVEKGVEILEESGFTAESFTTTASLPQPTQLDEVHANWRTTVIAKAAGIGLSFSHGVAAKLLNCYLKVRFVCAGYHNDQKVQALHPPIDALLLGALARQDYGARGQDWGRFHRRRWSKFDSQTYQSVIDLIRATLPAGQPLWMIEEHWEGHQ